MKRNVTITTTTETTIVVVVSSCCESSTTSTPTSSPPSIIQSVVSSSSFVLSTTMRYWWMHMNNCKQQLLEQNQKHNHNQQYQYSSIVGGGGGTGTGTSICTMKQKYVSFLSFLFPLCFLGIIQLESIHSFMIHTRPTIATYNNHKQIKIDQNPAIFTRQQQEHQQRSPVFVSTKGTRNILSMVGDARGDYYGESSGSFMVKEFNTLDELEEIVRLASVPLPDRPDGIVTVAKYTSGSTSERLCRDTEGEYERVARANPATLFLRCFQEYEDAEILFSQAGVTTLPTYDLFYQGNRVARVEGSTSSTVEIEELLERYQFQNSKLDLFSEIAPEPWGDPNQTRKIDYTRTPRTTARFVPGYDWNSDKGFFDTIADKAQNDFMGGYETSWIPRPDDDDNNNNGGKKKKK